MLNSDLLKLAQEGYIGGPYMGSNYQDKWVACWRPIHTWARNISGLYHQTCNPRKGAPFWR
jgi:hypothetical protein